MTARRRYRAVLPVAALLVTGCAGGDAAPRADGVTGDVTVLAAASLTDVLAEVSDRFEQRHPDTRVVVSTGGSTALAAQAVAGAPADVLVTASPEAMRVAVDGGATAGAPALLARNRLEIAVPAGNPAGVTGLADLADPALLVALCAPEVPCGAASEALLAGAGVGARPDTLERDVRAVLTKVRLGEVDAGLVYRTDVLAAGRDVEGIAVPGAQWQANDYLVARLDEAPNPEGAASFVDLLLSDAGREVLGGAGFDVP